MLSEEELVTSIKDKMPDFPIHVSDLKAPTGKFVQSYYVRILEELGMDVDALKEPQSEQLQKLDYSDAYRHILPLTNLHGALCYVFEHICVDNFSILDLIEPSPQRTQFLMKAMDGFHTYADWKAQSLQDSIVKLHKHKALRAQCEELKGQLDKRASERAQREMRKKEAEAHASELKNQIVKSPIQLEAELNRVQKEREKSEEEKQHLAQVMQEKSRQKNLYEKFLRMQEECEIKLKDILSLHTCLKADERKQDETEKKKQASIIEEQEIKEKTRKLCMKITQLQEQNTAFGMQWEKRKAALIQSIEETNREQDHLKKKLDDANSKVDEIRAEGMEMEEKFNSLRLLSEKQNKKYEELYAEKTAKQDACVKKILDIQKSIVENLKKHK